MMPLDGGNVAASTITLVTRRDGTRPARYLSIAVAASLGLYAAIAWQSIFIAFFAGMIVFINWGALKGGTSGALPFIGTARGTPANRRPPSPSLPAASPPPGYPPAPARPPTASPGPVTGPVPTSRAPGDLLIAGYRALDRHESATAASAAKAVLATRPEGEVKAAAVELAGWALLQQAEPSRARQALGQLPPDRQPSPYLEASVRLAEGDLPRGLSLMADAFVRSDEAAPRVQGANFVASAGLTRELAEELVAYPDGVGLVPAMRLQTLLSKLGRPAHAAMVDEVLLGGSTGG